MLSSAKHIDPMGEAGLALRHAVYRILVSLVRILLRHGMPFHTFARLAKRAYVEVASEPEFALPNRKQTKSRIAMLTGLNRPDVQRTLEDPVEEEEGGDGWSKACAVLGGWHGDHRFMDSDGEPLELPLHAEELRADLTLLVREHAGTDVSALTVIEELVAAGCVERIEESDRYRVLRGNYLPEGGSPKLLLAMGDAVTRLLETIKHNLTVARRELVDGEDSYGPGRFRQREVWSSAIPAKDLDIVRGRLFSLLDRYEKDAASILEEFETLPARPYHREAGIGLFYFEG